MFSRVWDALVLAAYFNMNSGFYYEMFSNFMGKGDKESFSFAFAATQTPYFMVPHPVGSLGVMRHYCRCCTAVLLCCVLPTAQIFHSNPS